MALRQKRSSGGGGCPDYMLTYGDMMSLLLCFFVMLVSISQVKEQDSWQAIIESLKKAFGHNPTSHLIPGDRAPFNAMNIVDSVKEHIRRSSERQAQDQQPRRQQQFGRSSTVRMVREGMIFTVGGKTDMFEKGTAKLTEEAEKDLLEIIEPIRGYRNKITVRGHTSRSPLPESSAFANHMDLSYARAAAVAAYMIEKDIDRDRVTIEACAGNEPVRLHAYDRESAAENDRVEIIVRDTMVQDFQGSKQPPEQESGEGQSAGSRVDG
jgi:chemotaxis protein MotB